MIHSNLTRNVKCVPRPDMIIRAYDWKSKNVPYNISYEGYISDAAGYISMIWMLGPG